MVEFSTQTWVKTGLFSTFFFYFFSFQISLFLNASLRYVLRRTTRVKGRWSEDKTCQHVNMFRLWCAIQKYKGQMCSLCPPELLSISANNEPCGLWEELQLLQVRRFIHSFIHSFRNIFISGVAAGHGNNIKSSFITQKNMFSSQIDVSNNYLYNNF